MTRAEQMVKRLETHLKDKVMLEVACGCGEFSLAAAGLAREIHCLDLDADRLLPGLKNCPNVVFDQMDAAAMTYPANCFDIVVL